MYITRELANILVEWAPDEPIPDIDDCRAHEETTSCLDLFNVRYIESFLSEQRDRMICHFTAPDAESVRQAMRGAGLKAKAIWAGSVYSEPGADTGNVIVEFLHEPSFDVEAQARRDDAVIRAFNVPGVHRSRVFQSLDGMRTISLLAVPDAEAVNKARGALRQLSDAAWLCEHRN